MDQNTINNGIIAVGSNIPQLVAQWRGHITRANGKVEPLFGGDWKTNQVTAEGLNALASRAVSDTTSPFGFMAVGTQTAAASLGSTVTGFGEVSRKTPTTITSSREIFYATNTWGGAADSVTSLALETAAIVNHVNSGFGVSMNQITGVNATLADSDFLFLETRIRVGSHNI